MKWFVSLALILSLGCGDDADPMMDAGTPDAPIDAPTPDAGMDAGPDDVGMPDTPDAPPPDVVDAGPDPMNFLELIAATTLDEELDIAEAHAQCDGAGFRFTVPVDAIAGLPDRVMVSSWNLRTRALGPMLDLTNEVTGWTLTADAGTIGFACDREYESNFMFIATRPGDYAGHPVAPDEYRGAVIASNVNRRDVDVVFTATTDVAGDEGRMYAWDLYANEYASTDLETVDGTNWTGTIPYEFGGVEPDDRYYLLVGGIVYLEELAIGNSAD